MKLHHVCADDATADDGQQRKRRGRIGNVAAEPSTGAKDNQRHAALEPVEDMLSGDADGDRSSGEMLMECVVKVCDFCLWGCRICYLDAPGQCCLTAALCMPACQQAPPG